MPMAWISISLFRWCHLMTTRDEPTTKKDMKKWKKRAYTSSTTRASDEYNKTRWTNKQTKNMKIYSKSQSDACISNILLILVLSPKIKNFINRNFILQHCLGLILILMNIPAVFDALSHCRMGCFLNYYSYSFFFVHLSTKKHVQPFQLARWRQFCNESWQ